MEHKILYTVDMNGIAKRGGYDFIANYVHEHGDYDLLDIEARYCISYAFIESLSVILRLLPNQYIYSWHQITTLIPPACGTRRYRIEDA